jgi:hypothetical protein
MPIMAGSIFDGPLTKEEQAALGKFIVHLFDFYKEHSGDKYIHQNHTQRSRLAERKAIRVLLYTVSGAGLSRHPDAF